MTSSDASGLTRWSRNDLEVKAQEVIEFFDTNTLKQPSMTPIPSFITRCCEESWLEFDATSELGVTGEGSRILGEFIFKPPTIRIDPSILNTPKEGFTLAHEFGHFVLHRNITIKSSDYSGNELRDTKRDLVRGNKILETPRDWIEWQANYFATALLVPRATVRDAVIQVQRKMGVLRNLGRVVLTPGAHSCRDFSMLVENLGVIYNASKSVVKHRLSDLGILDDLRDKDSDHISRLLREEG